MKVTADTNILVRAVVRDHALQGQAAADLFGDAELIAVPLPCLCEFAWVLRGVYGFGQDDVAAALRALVGTAKVVVDRPAVEAGLAVLEAGGDFADGVIAHAGRWLGGEIFVSFDRKAVALLDRQGQRTTLLG